MSKQPKQSQSSLAMHLHSYWLPTFMTGVCFALILMASPVKAEADRGDRFIAGKSRSLFGGPERGTSEDWKLCAPRELFTQGLIDNDSVIAACTRIIDSKADTARRTSAAYSDRGYAYLRKSNPERAIQDFDAALQIDPDNAYARAGRGQSFADMGRFDEALTEFNLALDMNPAEATFLNNRAIVYSNLRKTDEAMRDYDRALAINPEYPRGLNNRGNLYIFLGKFERAIEDLSSAIKLDPRYARAYANRGSAYLKLGRFDEAISDLEKAIALNPDLTFVSNILKEAKAGQASLKSRLNAPNSGKRIALVIGNSRYEHDSQLPNARQDARAIAKLLRSLDYKIYGDPEKDYRKTELEKVIEEFRVASVGADSAIVWYTGHGQKMREEGSEIADDWVIPVDAVIQERKDVAKAAVRVERLKGSVLAAKRLRLVVIDACRQSKFFTGTMGGGMKNEPAPGALIVYSTQPGNTADAGPDDGHSPFAQAFIELLPNKAKLDVRKFFDAVAGRTLEINPEQSPQSISGLATDADLPIAK